MADAGAVRPVLALPELVNRIPETQKTLEQKYETWESTKGTTIIVNTSLRIEDNSASEYRHGRRNGNRRSDLIMKHPVVEVDGVGKVRLY
jgi:hypothetical protein